MSSDDPKRGSGSSSADSGALPTLAQSSRGKSVPPGARTGTVAGTGAMPQARATGSAGPGTSSHSVPAAPGGAGPSILGQTIDGRYKIVDKLGEGGMGEVYAAEHVHIAKKVAIKLLRPEILANEEAVSRFRQEARSASSIGHTNIIAIEDFGHLADGRIYMCMEFLDGAPLNDLIKEALDPARALNILIQTGHGLAAAHAKGIVHRDMKPENVFVTGEPPVETPKLLDFGIAKVSGNEGNNHLTRTGTIFGTPYYMAPEQALGQAIDHRADIYAMGVIMFEVFCGAVPFQAESFMAILTQHITAPPPAPAQTAAANGRQLPEGLEAVILRCMQKEPDDRFATMDELVAALIGAYQSVAGAGMSAYFDAHQAPPSGGHPMPSGHLSSVIPSMRSGTGAPSSSVSMARAATEAAGHHGPGDSLDFAPPKKGKGVLVAFLMLLLAGAGGGGYYVYQQGLLQGGGDSGPGTPGTPGRQDPAAAVTPPDPEPDPPVVPDDPDPDPEPDNPDPSVQPGTVITPPVDPEPEPATMTVLVNSTPQGAKVYRDGKLMGKTPLNIAVIVGDPVELELRKRRFDDTVVLVDGSNDKMTFSLERKRRPGRDDKGNGKSDKPDKPDDKDKGDKGDKGDKDKPDKPPVNPDHDILE